MKPKMININILADKRAWVSFELCGDYPAPFFEIPEALLNQIFAIATDAMNEETIKIKESIET